jgi:aryl-alcohol dehydrogenase-like predicted oxidoreductase
MLEAAWDAGIRHFDVAPMYGFGEAESCLGEFARRHAGQVTVTTKYGIPPEQSRPVVRLARSIARPILQSFPGLKKRVAGLASAGAAPAPEQKATFTAEQAKSSLDRSLLALGTGRIDVWLLHEVSAAELRDEELLRLLEDSVKAGTVGTFGVGSDGGKIGDLLASRPEYCRTVQFQWSVLDPVPDTGGAFRIHHRALTDNFRSLHGALQADAERARRWSERTGADVADREVLAHLMLKAALVKNPGSIILFSSKNPAHIQANVRVASDASLTEPSMRLYELVQAERGAVGAA